MSLKIVRRSSSVETISRESLKFSLNNNNLQDLERRREKRKRSENLLTLSYFLAITQNEYKSLIETDTCNYYSFRAAHIAYQHIGGEVVGVSAKLYTRMQQ